MKTRSLPFLSATCLGLVLCMGCSQGSAPEATSQDEVANYLEQHPELKEKNEDIGYSDPSKP